MSPSAAFGAAQLPAVPGGSGALTRARTGSGAEERRLVEGLRRHDPDAVRQLHAEFGGVLYGYLKGAVGDTGAAEDVLQQVLFEAWQRGGSYEPARGSLLTWLFAIARSRAIDARRARVPIPTDPAVMTAARDRKALEHEDELDRLLEQWRLSYLLGRLPAGERDLLRLRFYRGLSQSEIAVSTGIPLGTVKMRMVSGLERLRELLAEEEQRR